MSANPILFREELEKRCRKFQEMIVAESIDLLVIDQPETIFYLIGHAMSEGFYQCCLLPSEGEPVMVLRTVDAGTCAEYSWISSIVGFEDWNDAIEIAQTVINSRKWSARSIGFDLNSYCLTVQRYSSWKGMFPEAVFRDVSSFIASQRAIKTPHEIECLRKASKIADQTLQSIISRIEVGYSARDCVAMSAENIILLGGDAGVVGPVTRSIDDTKMHALIDDAPIQAGDTLHIELIPQFLGYSARLMRPVCMGTPPDEMVENAIQIIGIQDEQFAAMKPGVRACEIDAIIRAGMLEHGLKDQYSNISGYSLGYYQQFTCRSSDFSYVFRPTDTWTLSAGMVFHMYTVAKGMAFSETVLVTDFGFERLTLSERSILSTDFRKAV